jgi:MFS family permease
LSLILPKKSTPAPVEGQTVVQEKTGIPRVIADMKEGAGFILHHAGLLFVIVALAAGMFVMGCFGPLIAVYVRDVLHALTKTYSIVSAMIGFGLLIGVNALNAFAKKMSNTLQVYLGLGGIALGTLLLAAIPTVATTILGCFLIGFSAAGIIVPSQTLVQQETPPELMGRVGSTLMSAIFSAQILGLVLSGILAQYTSIRGVFSLCTALLAALILAGKLWMEPAEHPALS